MFAKLKPLLIQTFTALAMLLLVVMPQVNAFTDGDYYATQNSTPFYDPTCATDAPSATTAAPPAATTSNKSVYIMGDSITALAKDSYTGSLGTAGYTATVEGLSSRHISSSPPSPSGLAQLDADKSKINSAGTIVIALGTNDSGESADAMEADVKKVVQKLKSPGFAADGAKIYWVNIIDTRHDAASQRTNTAISDGLGTDGTVIDWYSEAKAKADLGSFDSGVHPTKDADIKTLTDLVTKTITSDASTSSSSTSTTTNACCSTSAPDTPSGPASSGDKLANEIAIFDNLVGTMGFTPAQAYGIMGNLSVESGFNPRSYNPSTTTDNPTPDHAFGIVQWLGTRQTALKDSVPSGKKITDLDVQIKYMNTELSHDGSLGYKTSTATAIKALTGDESSVMSQAATIWNRNYEGSGEDPGPRIAAGRVVKNDLKDHAPPATATPAADPSTPSDASSAVCCPPTGSDTSGGTSDDSSPSDWVKMYTGANKTKVDFMGRGHLNKSDIKILVIHYTQGNQGGQSLLDFFNTQITGIQFNVDKDGKIYQYFPLTDMQRTNHVGNANAKSIGIEITGSDVDDLLGNDAQFQSVTALSKYLCDYYNIPCSEPKGDITGDSVATAQGLLGHDETPDGGHLDPDAKVTGSSVQNIPRSDSSKHPYMIKLRTALGFEPTPGHSGGSPAAATPTASTSTGDTVQCGSSDTSPGDTSADPVGDSDNKAIAMEAIKYGTAASGGKYTYLWGGLHGSIQSLKNFRDHGGGADCIGFVRYLIWKVYGEDISGMSTEGVPTSSDFKEITDKGDIQAGDIGWRTGHVDVITKNLGGGKLHQFGAHSEETGIHGGNADTNDYTKFYRYVGPKGSGN